MYLTFFKTPEGVAPIATSLDDFFKNAPITTDKAYEEPQIRKITVNRPEESFLNMYNKRKDLYRSTLPVMPAWSTEHLTEHYSKFFIPKKSGGMREINAPDDELKSFLSELKELLEHGLKIQNHEAAYAYTKERSALTSLKVHQENNSYWFLKLDMKNFFPSMSKVFVLQQLENTFPIGIKLHEDFEWAEKFIRCLDYAFLDNGLPQGTPLSPTLTNICMVGIDDAITRMLWEKKSRFVYTRYADDILISSRYKFNYKEIVDEINNILSTFQAPFRINPDKTRYGSRCGKNWNLGLMLNKDNKITLGHKRNQRFRAMLDSIMKDYRNGKRLSYTEKQEYLGQVAYFREINREETDAIIKRYEQKNRVLLKTVLNLKTSL